MTKWICNECKFSGQVCKCETTLYAPFCCVVHKIKQADWRIDNTDLNTATIESVETKTTLPDWCKVGEWVYSIPAQKYDKIIAIQYPRIVTREMKYTNDYINDGNVVQARLRPYNAEEMRGLVGKVLEHDGNASLVIVYLENGLIRVGTKWVSAERLIEDGYTIDGKPCGVLEHLKNGEWKA